MGSACVPALMGILARRVSLESVTLAIEGLFVAVLLLLVAAIRQRDSKSP